MSWDDVWTRRLARQFLAEPATPDRLVDVVGTVAGVQAQVMASAELAIGLRVAGITRQDVRHELWGRRRLVKTYGMRGTIHLFPANELSMWLAALRGARPPVRSAGLEASGTTPEQLTELTGAIGEALGDRTLTRDELGEEVVRRTGGWASDEVVPAFATMWPRWTVAIGAAATEGLLCFGPNRGNRVTFVRPERWFGPLDPIEPGDALMEVFRRYLRAFGPATPSEFARWFHMDPAAAEDLARALGPELSEVDVEGRASLLLAEDADEPTAPPRRGAVHLLPPFDGYVIGCHPRERLMPADLLDRLGHDRVRSTWARRALSGGSAANIPVLLVDGIVAGVWERRRAGRRLEIRVEPFVALSAGQRRGLERVAARIGAILGMEATFELGVVELRPHL